MRFLTALKSSKEWWARGLGALRGAGGQTGELRELAWLAAGGVRGGLSGRTEKPLLALVLELVLVLVTSVLLLLHGFMGKAIGRRCLKVVSVWGRMNDLLLTITKNWDDTVWAKKQTNKYREEKRAMKNCASRYFFPAKIGKFFLLNAASRTHALLLCIDW
jgi:hypothetical protein